MLRTLNSCRLNLVIPTGRLEFLLLVGIINPADVRMKVNLHELLL